MGNTPRHGSGNRFQVEHPAHTSVGQAFKSAAYRIVGVGDEQRHVGVQHDLVPAPDELPLGVLSSSAGALGHQIRH